MLNEGRRELVDVYSVSSAKVEVKCSAELAIESKMVKNTEAEARVKGVPSEDRKFDQFLPARTENCSKAR